ncbi:hypothetical protein BDN72DRAFT_958135 [Pluteus cervinus]|uniref:Uncharacterized protein n=1 Tax=Pluteus cervinus TaxID=181527 RepID=A0ACD3B0G7_9AGAR|nr:hypothetical protein BDN72DRAFT_958135 [Pluteus cervinus]
MQDPYRTTRRQFTDNLTAAPTPNNAAPAYANLHGTLKVLLDKLLNHPAMAPNVNQTFMTPAARKSKVYFMWDFVGRTLGTINMLDPTLPRREKGEWDEAIGRAAFAAVLINDATGKLQAMCPDDLGQDPDFGDEIRSLANDLGHP